MDNIQCGVPGCERSATCDHHILSVGAWREAAECEENKFPSCDEHHTMTDDSWHKAGITEFSERHGLEDVVERARVAVWARRREMDGRD
jgi:hypothetical protein